jgi:hypothetical protein
MKARSASLRHADQYRIDLAERAGAQQFYRIAKMARFRRCRIFEQDEGRPRHCLCDTLAPNRYGRVEASAEGMMKLDIGWLKDGYARG